jgi:hypothetical protein
VSAIGNGINRMSAIGLGRGRHMVTKYRNAIRSREMDIKRDRKRFCLREGGATDMLEKCLPGAVIPELDWALKSKPLVDFSGWPREGFGQKGKSPAGLEPGSDDHAVCVIEAQARGCLRSQLVR